MSLVIIKHEERILVVASFRYIPQTEAILYPNHHFTQHLSVDELRILFNNDYTTTTVIQDHGTITSVENYCKLRGIQ